MWENLVTVTLVLEKCLDFIIYVLTVTRMGVDHITMLKSLQQPVLGGVVRVHVPSIVQAIF